MAQRIKGIEETDAPIILKPLYIGFKRIAGKVGTSLKVLAHRPSIAWFGNLFGIAIEKSGKVEQRIHLLAQLRAAQIVECPFCIDIIPALGKKSGVLTDEEISAVSHYFDSDLFSVREKVALEYAEAISKTPVKVSDEMFGRLKNYFDEKQIVELTASIAFENYRARFNHALGIESDNFYK
ncbi:MAG: carboxymuconolactone decarboxylase family protein [Pyrinomonadaceae bacterium]